MQGEIIFPQDIPGCFRDTKLPHAKYSYAFLKHQAREQSLYQEEQQFYLLEMKARAHSETKPLTKLWYHGLWDVCSLRHESCATPRLVGCSFCVCSAYQLYVCAGSLAPPPFSRSTAAA